MRKLLERTGQVLAIYSSKRALRAFMQAAEVLLQSRLGELALAAASESDGNVFTRDEQRRFALATLNHTANRSGLEPEDCALRALLELALHKISAAEQKQETTIRATESFYL